MKLTVVRHTSVDVAKGICYGKTDVPLASTFATEMHEVRQAIGAQKFDRIFSSPLGRCLRLAREVNTDQAIAVDANLIELDFGDWEMADWNSIYDSQSGKEWFADYVNTPCPNGEAFLDLIARMRSFLLTVRSSQAKSVLVFTHAGNLRALMCLLGGQAPAAAFNTALDYGQILSFRLEDNES